MCRVICSQEIMYAGDNGISYIEMKKRLKMICLHELTKSTLKSYPLGTLPLKQRVFAYAMKYRLYLLLKILVELRK